MRNPRNEQRVALGILASGGFLAGVGVWLRDRTDRGNDQWTFFFDTGGLIIALVGGCLDFRATLKYGEFDPRATRRRGILLLLAGAVAGMGGCVLLGWYTNAESPALMRGVLSAVMTAGIAAGISGLLHIGWFGTGDHVERRIAQRADEEW